jgi:hypothetical protein
VRGWATHLGSGAMALERFTRMYHQVQQEWRAQAQQQQQGAAAQAAPSSASSGVGGDAPGGITSKTTLAPRLAVEQAEVKRIGSDAGQFGDFSRKPEPRRQAGSIELRQPPRGVLKKASRYAAGNQSMPIMLVEVKVGCSCWRQYGVQLNNAMPLAARCGVPRRAMLPGKGHGPLGPLRLPASGRQSPLFYPVPYRTDTACPHPWDRDKAPVRVFLLPPQERQPELRAAETASGLAPRSSGCAAAAVEGYVPRSSRRQQQRQRRVRFTDELPDEAAEASEAAAEAQEAAAEPVMEGAAEPESAAGDHIPAAGGQSQGPQMAGVVGGTAAPLSQAQSAGGATQRAVGGSQPSSVLVFEMQHGVSAADGLATQLGRLYVADSSTQDAAAAAPSPAQGSARAASSSIAIQPIPSTAVHREWLEVPQFYAHSPVGSSSSLAGSFASPAGSVGNLAALASSPQPARLLGAIAAAPVSPPPGLPRPPSSRAGSQADQERQGQWAPARQNDAASEQPQAQQDEEGRAPGTGQPLLTRHQAQQLQRAFPPLVASLPPELEAMLASSDSEAASEGSESDNWTASDDEADALGSERCGGVSVCDCVVWWLVNGHGLGWCV